MTSSKIYNFNDFLNEHLNSVLIVPVYQRLYAWDKEQIKIFLDDFKNCMNDNNKTYFIGNVVVAKNENDFELVDGQQRLSTIFFLCVYMCFKNNKMQEAGNKDFANAYKFAFVEKDKEEKCRIHMPIREDDENAIWNYDFDKTNTNIKLAFDCFNEYFNSDIEKLKSFCDFIFSKVNFNLVILGKQVELNKYFVRMNNTGVQLDGTDILKARLLKLISDYEKEQKNQNEKSEVAKYAKIFDECSQMNYFSDFGFVDSNVNNNITIEQIIGGENNLQNYSENESKRDEFESIIDFPTFILHVFKILFGNEIKIDKKKFLENTWDKVKDGLDSKKAKYIIKALKEYRSVFDKFVIKNKQGDDENNYRLYGGYKNEKLELIQNYLRVARRGDNNNYHHFLTNLLRYAKDNPYPDKIYLYLKNLDTALAYELLDKNNDNTLLSVAEEFQGESKECYMPKSCFEILDKGTNTQHYWFYRLEYYLFVGDYFKDEQGCIKNEFKSAVENYRFRYLNSVEHIYPQSKSDEIYKDDSGRIDCFGNLALISKNQNSSFSNKDFWEKQAQFYALKSRNDISSLKLLDFYSVEIEKDKSSEEIAKIIQDKIQNHQKEMITILENSFKR